MRKRTRQIATGMTNETGGVVSRFTAQGYTWSDVNNEKDGRNDRGNIYIGVFSRKKGARVANHLLTVLRERRARASSLR